MNATKKTTSTTLDNDLGKSLPSAITGKLNYHESYSAFLRDTTQTEDTTRIIGTFIDRLKKHQVFQDEKEPINVADIGCNDSIACLYYLKTVSHKAKFNYFGMDISKESLRKAEKLLLSNQIIDNYLLIEGDAFDGKIKQRKEFVATMFDLIFVSHSAYYVGYQEKNLKDESKYASFLLDISNLLSTTGVAILIHGNSFYSLSKKYGDFEVRDTPFLLEQGASLSFLNQLKIIKFTSRLSFAEMDDYLWEAMKHPNKYALHQHHSNFVDALEKILFIINCSFVDMKKRGMLSNFIDEVKEIIIKNGNSFPIVSFLQVIVSPHHTLLHKTAKALQETEDIILSLSSIGVDLKV